MSVESSRKPDAIKVARPVWGWGRDEISRPTPQLIGDVPSATAILDRFLHHATVIAITGKSYRLRNQKAPQADDARADAEDSKPANLPTGSAARRKPKSTSETSTAETTTACQS